MNCTHRWQRRPTGWRCTRCQTFTPTNPRTRGAETIVHNHGPEAGPGLSCPESRTATGALRGQCMTETRITSSTGGQKGAKGAQLGAIDPRALLAVAEVAGYGTQKYARYNFMRGYDWSLSYDAMQRHLLAFWSGEDLDPESGCPHLAHAAWHAMALLTFSLDHRSFDDRPGAVALEHARQDLRDRIRLSSLSPRRSRPFTTDPDTGQATPDHIIRGGQDA